MHLDERNSLTLSSNIPVYCCPVFKQEKCERDIKWHWMTFIRQISEFKPCFNDIEISKIYTHWIWTRVGGGGGLFLTMVLGGLNQMSETTGGKNRENSNDRKLVSFRVSNCLKRSSVCLDIIGIYSAFFLMGLLAGDSLKCVYMPLIIMGICFCGCKNAWFVLHTYIGNLTNI